MMAVVIAADCSTDGRPRRSEDGRVSALPTAPLDWRVLRSVLTGLVNASFLGSPCCSITVSSIQAISLPKRAVACVKAPLRQECGKANMLHRDESLPTGKGAGKAGADEGKIGTMRSKVIVAVLLAGLLVSPALARHHASVPAPASAHHHAAKVKAKVKAKTKAHSAKAHAATSHRAVRHAAHTTAVGHHHASINGHHHGVVAHGASGKRAHHVASGKAASKVASTHHRHGVATVHKAGHKHHGLKGHKHAVTAQRQPHHNKAEFNNAFRDYGSDAGNGQ